MVPLRPGGSSHACRDQERQGPWPHSPPVGSKHYRLNRHPRSGKSSSWAPNTTMMGLDLSPIIVVFGAQLLLFPLLGCRFSL